jgi:hypothetical protein
MICGAEACNLGAMIHGAELRVHFLKSFQKGSTCENLSEKGLKNKKDGTFKIIKKRCNEYELYNLKLKLFVFKIMQVLFECN